MSIKNRLEQLKQKQQEEIKENSNIELNIPKTLAKNSLALTNRIITSVKKRLADVTQWAELEEAVQRNVIKKMIVEEANADIEADMLIPKIMSQLNGYGVLDNIISEDDVDKIFVNSTNYINVQKNNQIIKVPFRFETKSDLQTTVKRILSLSKTSVMKGKYVYEGKLPNNMVFSLVFPPLSSDGITLCLEKIKDTTISLNKYAKDNLINSKAVKFLEDILADKKNIIIAGAHDVGKKTLLKALMYSLPQGSRNVCICDNKFSFVNMENIFSYNLSQSEQDALEIENLFENIFLQCPDTFICANNSKNVMFNVFKALNAGLQGFITTAYADKSNNLFEKMADNFVFETGHADREFVKKVLVKTIDYVIYLAPDNVNKPIEILQVLKTDENAVKFKSVTFRKSADKKPVAQKKVTRQKKVKK